MTDGKGTRKKPNPPVGPYAPPTPSEAERTQGEPMAVARDKETLNDAFLPTSAPLDAYSQEVADAYRAHGSGARGVTESRKENARMEDPPGYTEPDKQSFRRPKLGDEEE